MAASASAISPPPGFELEPQQQKAGPTPPPGFELETPEKDVAAPQSPLPAGEIPLTSYGAATKQGLMNIGKGVSDAATGLYNTVRHPIDTAESLIAAPKQLAAQVKQIPGALHDINASQDPVGSYMGVAGKTAGEGAGQAIAALAVPAVVRGARGVSGMLPSAERAGQAFQDVKAVAGANPIDVGVPGDAALEAERMANSGGSMPKVVRDFLKRSTDPTKPPLTYSEARDFYSNATRLSADETQRLTPVMKRQVGNFTRALGDSIQDTAEQAGKGDQLKGAMKEYSRAMRLKEGTEKAKDIAIKSAITGAGLGVGGHAVRKFFEK